MVKEKGREFYLLKPSTYMNLSGNAVRYWMQKLEVPLENIIVVCDDLNLPFCSPRLRKAGSNGGHNGLGNIQELLGTTNYARIRIGIGHEFGQGQQIGFVLGEFNEEERAEIAELSKKVIEGIQTWALAGIERAMTYLNSKPKAE